MELKELLKTVFEYKKLTWLVAYYETYYQMSLAFYVQKSGFDSEDMIKRISDLELEVDPEHIFTILIDLCNLYFIKDDPLLHIKNDLRHVASMNSLNDFVEKDKELLNKEIFAGEMLKDITEGKIHEEIIDKLVKSELPHRVKVWRDIIDTAIADEILERVIESHEGL